MSLHVTIVVTMAQQWLHLPHVTTAEACSCIPWLCPTHATTHACVRACECQTHVQHTLLQASEHCVCFLAVCASVHHITLSHQHQGVHNIGSNTHNLPPCGLPLPCCYSIEHVVQLLKSFSLDVCQEFTKAMTHPAMAHPEHAPSYCCSACTHS